MARVAAAPAVQQNQEKSEKSISGSGMAASISSGKEEKHLAAS